MRLLFDFVIIFHGTFEACVDVTLCSSCGKSGICINIWLKRSRAPGGLIWIFTHFKLETASREFLPRPICHRGCVIWTVFSQQPPLCISISCN